MSPNESIVAGGDDPTASMALEYNDSMKDFIKERIDNPYDVDRTTSKYVAESMAILGRTANALESSDEERAESLDDALLLTKCFAATVSSPPQPSSRMTAFLDFVHSVQPDMSRFQPEVIAEIKKDHTESLQFWESLRYYILLGSLDDAQQLLMTRLADPQTDGQSDDLVQLIQEYPLKTSRQSSFMRWRQDVLAYLDSLRRKGSIRTSKDEAQFEQIVLILSGDMNEILRSSENWVEALCGLTLFSDPTFDSVEQNFITANEKLGLVKVPTWEEGCKALFEDRIVAASSSLKLLDLGTAVVFSEFCNESNLSRKYTSLSTNADASGINGGIREELGLEYVDDLSKKAVTVDIGLEMLSNIGNEAARTTAEAELPKSVERFPSKAESAIDTAEQLGLNDLDASLSQIAAETHWSAHRYIPALELFYRSGDYNSLRDCGWHLFEEILITRDVPQGEVESDAASNDIIETATVLRDYGTAEDIGLAPMILDSIAPSAVLLQLLDGIAVEDVGVVIANVRGLLMSPNDKLQYYPLLVGLLSNATPGALPIKDTVMLMDALDVWDRASDESKSRSQDLIEKASEEGNWQDTLIGSTHDSKHAVWSLRKHLAKSIVL